MTRKRYPRFATRLPLLCVLVLAFVPSASAEWKEKVLYSFQGGADGSTPAGGVVFDKAGNLYGATTDGGSNFLSWHCGVRHGFPTAAASKAGRSLDGEPCSTFSKATNSNDGATPAGGVIFDQAGNLYGTTAYGGSGDCVLVGTTVGCGTVYQMTPPTDQRATIGLRLCCTAFRAASDGYVPQGNLTFDSAGNLYGVTLYGGGYGSCNAPYYQYCGTVFKLSPPKTKGGKWKEKVLYSFKSGTDGANPNGGLVLDSKGAIYGTTYAGGNQNCKADASVGCGTVFALQPPLKKGNAWVEKMLHRFTDGNDGAQPGAGVIIDAKGVLYGGAEGGPKGGGIVFRLEYADNGRWKETILYSFTVGFEGGYDPAISLDESGDFYGTTNVGPAESMAGSVFRVKPSTGEEGSWAINVLHGFTNRPDGAFPNTPLTFDKSRDLYGATQAGGTGQSCQGGCGTVFEVEP